MERRVVSRPPSQFEWSRLSHDNDGLANAPSSTPTPASHGALPTRLTLRVTALSLLLLPLSK